MINGVSVTSLSGSLLQKIGTDKLSMPNHVKPKINTLNRKMV